VERMRRSHHPLPYARDWQGEALLLPNGKEKCLLPFVIGGGAVFWRNPSKRKIVSFLPEKEREGEGGESITRLSGKGRNLHVGKAYHCGRGSVHRVLSAMVRKLHCLARGGEKPSMSTRARQRKEKFRLRE